MKTRPTTHRGFVSEVSIQTKIFKGNKHYENQSNEDPSSSSFGPVHLDLSFKNIERISNLNGFGNIISLVLNNNQIKRISGVDQLVQLKRYVEWNL